MTHRSHALDTAEFCVFAAACVTAVRGDPTPPRAPVVDPALLGALATRHRIAAPVLDRLTWAAREPVPALALQLYGDVAARDSKDLDLLVDPARFEVATRAITALGYALEDDHDALAAAAAHAPKHRTFRHGSVEVEMHTRLLDMDDFIAMPIEHVWARRADIALRGGGSGERCKRCCPSTRCCISSRTAPSIAGSG